MLQMNEDEGFAQQSPTEYTQYSYSPCAAFKEAQHRPYVNPLKYKPQAKPLLPPEAYINNDLQLFLYNKFAAGHSSPIYRPTGAPINSNLAFDSAFENGNLQYVIPRANCFQLYIRPDTNTMTHFQWFYFKVRNKRPATITMVIKNFLKPKMSYLEGLKPYFRSNGKQQKYYEQIPGNVSFYQAEEESEPQLYELSFEYCLDIANDEVQFCSQPPYPYSRYCKIYKCLPFTRVDISRTVLGNKIEAFLCNDHANTNAIAVIMARQHPGESVGSWLMQGFINRLMDTPNDITWILIPMVNIDGVVLGNNRTGVQGYDFNRHWYIDQDTNRYHLFPELKGITTYFKRKKKEHAKKIKIFIDFHGHSSEPNVFAYGPPHFKTSEHHDLSKVLPYLISKRNSDFCLKQCSYHLEPYKKGCSRYVFLHKFGFTYSYTIQSSFGLYKGRKINEKDMLKMGEDVLISTIDFANMLTQSKEKSPPLKEILSILKEEVIEMGAKRQAYDSDSENENQNAPIRRQFEQKLVKMLTKEAQQLEGSLFERLLKKRDDTSFPDQHRRQTKVNATTAVARTNQRPPRMRTEDSRKTPEPQQEIIFLPRVKLERKARSSKKNFGNLCDLDRLSLQEMKERLMKMKHSELGKRILIVQNS